MQIALGADHAGYDLKTQLKAWLEECGHQILDLGAHELDPSDDYPDFAAGVARAVAAARAERGLLVCGSGVGACVTANKVAGARAGLCHDTYSSRQGVEHDDMNILCLGARVIGPDLAREIVRSFLSASFVPEPRFQRRLEKLLEVEKEEK